MKSVVVIGGGIIGLSSAYFLAREGHEVTVLDASAMDSGASYVNAGYLSPSHIMPLASPGVVRQGLRWMLDPKSPLFIRPELNSNFIRWALAFNRSCSSRNVETSIRAIRDIAVLSRDLYDGIRKAENFNYHLEKKGLIMMCVTENAMEKEIKVAKRARQEELEAEVLSKEQVAKMEPKVAERVVGGIHYICDWHSTPQEFMAELKQRLRDMGVGIYPNSPVENFTVKNDRIESVIVRGMEWQADEFVMAAGSWSTKLGRSLGMSIPMVAGKGYRINSHRDLGINYPAIFSERKAAVTPMNGFTRFGGTMEINGINHKINRKRVEAIAEAVEHYYEGIQLTEEEKNSAACGLRPVSPDGRPFIGKSAKCKNLTIATGHAMMGWSMGPGTGKLVSEIISEKKTSMSLEAFHPDRKF